MKKVILLLAIVAFMAGSTLGAQLLAGGNVPLVNNIVGVGVMTLDFSGPGTQVDIGTYIINNNSDSYDVSWTFSNSANFRRGAADIPLTLLTVEPSANQPAGSNLGTNCEVLVPGNVWDGADKTAGGFLVQAQTGAACTYIPSDQTDATVNYAIVIKASWADASTMLAGLYTETVTFTIVATIN